MRYFCAPAVAVFVVLMATPAFAQIGGGGLGGAGGSPAPQPREPVPDAPPPALPGANAPAVATAPVLHKAITGDPTTALFTAINGNDYNAAQEAIGRGADLNAHNALGETPLDLSVALNRNSITFLLLGARNETAEASGGAIGAPISLAAPSTKHQKSHAAPKATAVAVKMPPNVTGTPDPAAGFLGFGTK